MAEKPKIPRQRRNEEQAWRDMQRRNPKGGGGGGGRIGGGGSDWKGGGGCAVVTFAFVAGVVSAVGGGAYALFT